MDNRNKGYSGALEADLIRSEARLEAAQNHDLEDNMVYRQTSDGEIRAGTREESSATKEESFVLWQREMEARFVRGDDSEFDYKTVDENEGYDDHALERQEAEDKYFDEEDPEYVIGDDGARRTKSQEGRLQGETGVQDF
jgi:hypothetical protein